MASPLLVRHILEFGIGVRTRRQRYRLALAQADIDTLAALAPELDDPTTALLGAVDSFISSDQPHEIPNLEPLVALAPPADQAIFRVLTAHIRNGPDAGKAEAEAQAQNPNLPNRFSRWAETWQIFLSLPTPKRAAKRRPLPGSVIQFWDTEEVPRDIRPEMDRWSKASGDTGYCRFNARTSLEFLEEHYSPTEILLFEEAPHAAVQSDLMRLWALRVLGGIYVDADTKMMPSFPALAPSFDKPTLWFRTTHAHCRVQNSFLAFPPAHPFIDEMLETTKSRMYRDPDQSILSLSGPAMATDTLLQEARAGRLQDFQALSRTTAADQVFRQINAAYKSDDRNWRRFQAKRAAELGEDVSSDGA